MILKAIYAQRKEAYPGEYAPEALECMDEYGYDENPDYLDTRLAHHRSTNEFESVVIIDIDVDGNEIMNRLRPGRKAIKGDIQ